MPITVVGQPGTSHVRITEPQPDAVERRTDAVSSDIFEVPVSGATAGVSTTSFAARPERFIEWLDQVDVPAVVGEALKAAWKE